jgi:hypothetical protein
LSRIKKKKTCLNDALSKYYLKRNILNQDMSDQPVTSPNSSFNQHPAAETTEQPVQQSEQHDSLDLSEQPETQSPSLCNTSDESEAEEQAKESEDDNAFPPPANVNT